MNITKPDAGVIDSRRPNPQSTRFEGLFASLETAERALRTAAGDADGQTSQSLQAEYRRMLDALPQECSGVVPLPPDFGLRLTHGESGVAIDKNLPHGFGRRGRVAQAGFPRRAARSRAVVTGAGRSLWRVGLVSAFLVTVWAGYAYATRDGSRPWLFPVAGTVLVHGKPAAGAAVVLYPENSASEVRPKGFVKPDGSFELTTYLPADGAPRGDYRMTIEWRKPVKTRFGEYLPGPNLLPAALSRPETTKYRASVGWGKNKLPPLEIAP